LEGFQDSATARAAGLESRLHKLSDVHRIEAEEIGDFWRKLRDLSSFAADLDACVWRLMLPGTQAAKVVNATGCQAVYLHGQ
jgi:glycolate oxidase FAD binding subunit